MCEEDWKGSYTAWERGAVNKISSKLLFPIAKWRKSRYYPFLLAKPLLLTLHSDIPKIEVQHTDIREDRQIET